MNTLYQLKTSFVFCVHKEIVASYYVRKPNMLQKVAQLHFWRT